MDVKPVIIIGGFAATGSSSLAKKLSSSLDLKYIYAGYMMRQLCVERGYCSREEAFSDKFEGVYTEFSQRLLKDKSLNQELDNKILEYIKTTTTPSCVEARVAAALVTKEKIPVVIKIWVTASIEDRVKRFRIKHPDTKLSDKEIKELLLQRQESEIKQYKEQYGIDLSKPQLYNDLILDTSGLTLEESYFKFINHPLVRERIKLLIPFYPNYDVVYRWKCLVCGYTYEGFVHVHICPKCGNIDESKFKDL